MEETHAMKWFLIYYRDLVVRYVLFFGFFLHFFICSKYDFHVDAEK